MHLLGSHDTEGWRPLLPKCGEWCSFICETESNAAESEWGSSVSYTVPSQLPSRPVLDCSSLSRGAVRYVIGIPVLIIIILFYFVLSIHASKHLTTYPSPKTTGHILEIPTLEGDKYHRIVEMF